MAAWPTNQSTSARVSSAAAPTKLDTLAWSFDLSRYTVAGGSGSVSKTYDFSTTTDGWFADFPPPDAIIADGGVEWYAGFAGDLVVSVDLLGLGVPYNAVFTHVEISGALRNMLAISVGPAACRADVGGFGLAASTLWLGTIGGDTDPHSFSGSIDSGSGVPWYTGAPNSFRVGGQNYSLPPFSAGGLLVLTSFSFSANWTNGPITEHFLTAPVVGADGNLRVGTQDSTDRCYLLCIDVNGNEVFHVLVQDEIGQFPGIGPVITVDDNGITYITANDQSVHAYNSAGALLWRHGDSSNFTTRSRTTAMGPDGFLYCENSFSGNVVMEALVPADGTIDHSFSAGAGFNFGGGSFAIAGTSIYIPIQTSSLKKTSLTGTPEWSVDVTAVPGNWGNDVRCPSIANGHVVLLSCCGTDGDVGLLSLADTDGSFEWAYHTPDLVEQEFQWEAPAIDPVNGTIYVSLDGTVGNAILAAINPSDGSEIWRSSDAAETGGTYYAASVGNDGGLLLTRADLMRINTSNGSGLQKVTLTNPFPAALSSANAYIADGPTVIPGVLYAYGGGGGGPVPVPFTGIRSEGQDEARATLSNAAVAVSFSGKAEGWGSRAVLLNGALIPPVVPSSPFTDLINYYTVADTPQDVDAPGTVVSRLITRPYDVNNVPQARSKRTALLVIHGQTRAKKGQVIGKVTWVGDGKQIGTYPLRAWVTNRWSGALCEVCPPSFVAEVAWVELEFTVNDLVLENMMWEYSYLN